jgi:twitching motility protein PilT
MAPHPESIMAKLDKFISILIQKGGHTLRLDPGEYPIAELPGGQRINLGVQEMMGSVLDGLAKEVVPANRETDYLRGEKVQFPYEMDGQAFILLCVKSPYGSRIVAVKNTAKEGASSTRSSGPVAPGQGLWEDLLGKLLALGASDLFLNPGESPIVQSHGRFTALEDQGLQAQADIEQLAKALAPKALWEAFEQGSDVEFSINHAKRQCRLRLNLLHGSAGPALAVRVMPSAAPDAESLGLREEVRRLAGLSRGLVLLSGPQGSGRSTTLASLLALARRRRSGDFILTVEDAIAFPLPAAEGVSRQREVGGDPRRQAQAVRAALRQQPDILAVDEWSSEEALEPLLEAACEGRLVILVLQSASALDALRRVVEGFPRERRPWIQSLLASSLKASLCLDLVPRTKGGRVMVQETLFNTPAVADLIREGAFAQIPAAAKGARYGQLSLAEAMTDLVKRQEIEAAEAYRRSGNREALVAAFKKAGVDFDPRREGRITEE